MNLIVSPETPKTEEIATEPLTPYQEMRANIEEENSKNIATYNAAIRDKNPELCNTITEKNKKIECQDTIISAEAKKT
jgi:hypothetical protein